MRPWTDEFIAAECDRLEHMLASALALMDRAGYRRAHPLDIHKTITSGCAFNPHEQKRTID